jgi:2-C-methyl-D-erythritol 4-phosphate cytidylyltransferase
VSPTAALVLLAAGSGSRSGLAGNKVFAVLAGRRVLTWSLDATRDVAGIGPVLVVARAEEADAADRALREESPGREVRVVTGGASRHASERNALEAIRPAVYGGEVDVVVIHDAARPLAPTAVFTEVIAAAREHGGAVRAGCSRPAPAKGPAPVRGARSRLCRRLRPSRAGCCSTRTTPRRPRVRGDRHRGLRRALRPRLRIHALRLRPPNLKITFPEDLALAERLVARRVR